MHVKGFHDIDKHVPMEVVGVPFDIWAREDRYVSLCPSCSHNPKGEEDEDELEIPSLITNKL